MLTTLPEQTVSWKNLNCVQCEQIKNGFNKCLCEKLNNIHVCFYMHLYPLVFSNTVANIGRPHTLLRIIPVHDKISI